MKLPKSWCSGHRVFPDGLTCKGCPDCEPHWEWEFPPESPPTPEQLAYRERCQHQLDEWVKGNPIHNTVDDECCPDFSCCKPEFLQPEEIRKTFAAAKGIQRESMLWSFFSSAVSTLPGKPIFVANGRDEYTTPLN